jgi:hypothetical protein
MGIRVIKNEVPKLFFVVKELQRMTITIGYQGETGAERYESGITVAHNAAIQEFGFKHIPKRPFMRETLFRQQEEIKREMAKAVQKVVTLKELPEEALIDAAIAIKAMFVKTIDDAQSWAAANAPSTIKAKGHDKPLTGGAPPDDGPVRKLKENLSWAIRYDGRIIAEGR